MRCSTGLRPRWRDLCSRRPRRRDLWSRRSSGGARGSGGVLQRNSHVSPRYSRSANYVHSSNVNCQHARPEPTHAGRRRTDHSHMNSAPRLPHAPCPNAPHAQAREQCWALLLRPRSGRGLGTRCRIRGRRWRAAGGAGAGACAGTGTSVGAGAGVFAGANAAVADTATADTVGTVPPGVGGTTACASMTTTTGSGTSNSGMLTSETSGGFAAAACKYKYKYHTHNVYLLVTQDKNHESVTLVHMHKIQKCRRTHSTNTPSAPHGHTLAYTQTRANMHTRARTHKYTHARTKSHTHAH